MVIARNYMATQARWIAMFTKSARAGAIAKISIRGFMSTLSRNLVIACESSRAFLPYLGCY